jgi:hypothetical protein
MYFASCGIELCLNLVPLVQLDTPHVRMELEPGLNFEATLKICRNYDF